MTTATEITFSQYKEVVSLIPEDDHFEDYLYAGCSESDFEQWCDNHVLFHKLSGGAPFKEVLLTEKMWEKMENHYTKESEDRVIKAQYPADGFFEAKNGDMVACLLPDTYGHKPYRVSRYKANGPITHHTFNDRDEACQYLARNRFEVAPGALDALTDTSEWHRGLWICKWAYEGTAPFEGIRFESQNPEIQRLFADALEHLSNA